MTGATDVGQVAGSTSEAVIIAAAPSGTRMNESEFELTPPGEMENVIGDEGKKRSKLRLVAILIALNVSCKGRENLSCAD